MSPDPFRTAALRRAVLDAWASSPTRFREDANAEEDLVLGGYRDRWFVELAQNAADAASRRGAPGRLRVSCVDGELRVANTGAPLDAAGVASLASLRASAKRDGVGVGRFGVGFAAVLAVSAEPRVVSTGGGVLFSASRTAAELAGLSGVDGELARRGGRVPVLRLAWPTDPGEPPPPEGFDAEVRLPLLAGARPADLLADALAQASDLLLALPPLHSVEVAGRLLGRRDDGDTAELTEDGRVTARWALVRRSGTVPAALLAGLAVEERNRPVWTVSWAVPAEGGLAGGRGGGVLHAPTPTDERLTLPARLFATLPLEPSRRRVRPGPVADHVLAAAGACYPDLVAALPPARRAELVPLPALPASDVDGVLREAVLAALRHARWLTAAGGGEIRPADAVALDVPAGVGLVELLADVVPGLLAAPVPPWPALAVLGVRRLRLGELVDRLAGLARTPPWWRSLYAELEPLARVDGTVREELGALPVPLVDGRTVLGPRTAVVALPGGSSSSPGSASTIPGGGSTVPGLRVVHPDAAHPLLGLLGAREAGPAELLDDPALREAVERSVADAEAGLDVALLAECVLALVDQAGRRPWLGSLALPAADGEARRADELVLPDGALRAVLAADSPVGVLDATLAAAHPRQALTDVGVLDGFAVLVDEDPGGPEHDLADEAAWWATWDQPPARLVAVRDLDLVDPARWPAALALLAADPAARGALARRVGEPAPYTSWWLSRFAVLDGHPPRYWRLPSAASLAGLFDPAPAGLDERLLAEIGVRTGLDVADAVDALDLLDRLADPARTASAALVRAAHAELAAAVSAGRVAPADVEPPASVRTLSGAVVHAGVAVVLDRPWLAAVLPAAVVVAGGDPEALADLLDLPLASEQVRATVASTGVPTEWAELPELVAACETLGFPVPAGTFVRHDELLVRLAQPEPGEHRVPAWVDQTGRVHAADPLRGLLAARSLTPPRDDHGVWPLVDLSSG